MQATPDTPPAQIELVLATPDQAPILANLLELYAHDFSEFYPVEIGTDGRFGYQALPLYWSQPDRYPFLVKADGKLAGLAFVKKSFAAADTGIVWDIAEFFVLRAYRRQGIGTTLAHLLWHRFPGQWEVRVMQANIAGINFWQHAITAFTGTAIAPVQMQKDGATWHIYAFKSGNATAK